MGARWLSSAYRPAMHAMHTQPLPRAGGGGGGGLSPCHGLGLEGLGEGGRATLIFGGTCQGGGWGGSPRPPSGRPLPHSHLRGLWGCVVTAALGGGSVSSPAALLRSLG